MNKSFGFAERLLKELLCSLTCFFTLVTKPLSLQSTVSGKLAPSEVTKTDSALWRSEGGVSVVRDGRISSAL